MSTRRERLEQPVLLPPRRVVAGGVAEGLPEGALPPPFPRGRGSLAGAAWLPPARGQGVSEAERTVEGSQQDGAAVGTGGLRVKTRLDLLTLPVQEQDTLYHGIPLWQFA